MGTAASRQTAFWEACGYGNTIQVKKLLAEGEIDVDWRSFVHDSCPIHLAAQGKEDIVKILLDHKCNVNKQDDKGNLAIHHAAMHGHCKIIDMLVDAGSEINWPNNYGWTPVITAAYYCQPDAVRLLSRRGADCNIENKEGRSALHMVCRSESEDELRLAETVRVLVRAGCDVSAKSTDVSQEVDFTPLMYAAYHGHSQILRVLIEAGADVNAQASNSWSALHWAADRGQLKAVIVLLGNGADALLRGKRGELALDRATNNEIKEILRKAVQDKCDTLISKGDTLSDMRALSASIQRTEAEHSALFEKRKALMKTVAPEVESEHEDELGDMSALEIFRSASMQNGFGDPTKESRKEEKKVEKAPEQIMDDDEKKDQMKPVKHEDQKKLVSRMLSCPGAAPSPGQRGRRKPRQMPARLRPRSPTGSGGGENFTQTLINGNVLPSAAPARQSLFLDSPNVAWEEGTERRPVSDASYALLFDNEYFTELHQQARVANGNNNNQNMVNEKQNKSSTCKSEIANQHPVVTAQQPIMTSQQPVDLSKNIDEFYEDEIYEDGFMEELDDPPSDKD